MATHTRTVATGGATIAGEWECDQCGFTRRGTLRNRPGRCPECSASGDAFSFWSDDEDEDDSDDLDDDDDEWDDDEDDWDDDEDDF